MGDSGTEERAGRGGKLPPKRSGSSEASTATARATASGGEAGNLELRVFRLALRTLGGAVSLGDAPDLFEFTATVLAAIFVDGHDGSDPVDARGSAKVTSD